MRKKKVAGIDAPHEGEVVWVDFDPAVGHEQRGRRPALVVSRTIYQTESSYVIVCPITRNIKPWPYKVLLPEDCPIKGAVLVDQVKSIDRRHRVIRRVGSVSNEVLSEVRHKLAGIVGVPLTYGEVQVE